MSSDYCGVSLSQSNSFEAARTQCCVRENDEATSTGDCDSSKWPKGPAFNAIINFAEHENDWLKSFQSAWWIATENGHEGLVRTGTGNGKKKQMNKRGRSKKGGQKKRGSKSSKRGSKRSRGKKGRGRKLFLI